MKQSISVNTKIMVNCSIASCTSRHSSVYNGRNIVFFKLPEKRNVKKNKGKRGLYRSKINAIKNEQHHAWLNAIERGYANKCIPVHVNKNIRICAKYFHTSTIIHKNNDEYKLKIGASPTLYLTKFTTDNPTMPEHK